MMYLWKNVVFQQNFSSVVFQQNVSTQHMCCFYNNSLCLQCNIISLYVSATGCEGYLSTVFFFATSDIFVYAL